MNWKTFGFKLNPHGNRHHFKKYFKNHYLKDTVILLGGNGVKLFLGFLINVILAKLLGPFNYGFYFTIMTIVLICVNISDFGLGNALNRLTRILKDQINEVLSVIFGLKILLLLIFLSLIYIFVPYISDFIKTFKQIDQYLRLAILLILAESVFRFILAIFQSQKRFKKYSLLLILNNSFRFSGIIILFIFSKLTILYVLLLYLTSFLILTITQFPAWKFRCNSLGIILKEVFPYAFWVWMFIIFNTLFVKSDILIANILNYSELVVGNYSLYITFVSIMNLIQASIFTQLLPKTMHFTKKHDYHNYYQEVNHIRIILVAFCFLYILLIPIVLKMFYQDQYSIHYMKFVFLGLPFVFSLFNEFNSVLLYSLQKHHFIFIAYVIGLVVLCSCFCMRIEMKSIDHIMYAVIISKLVVDLYIYIQVKRCIKTLKS